MACRERDREAVNQSSESNTHTHTHSLSNTPTHTHVHLLSDSSEETGAIFGDGFPPEVLRAKELVKSDLIVTVGLWSGAFTPHYFSLSRLLPDPAAPAKLSTTSSENWNGSYATLLTNASLSCWLLQTEGGPSCSAGAQPDR